MGSSGFTKLPPYSSEGVRPVNIRRRRLFSPVELGLLIALILLATALAIFSVVYIVQHRGVIRPAAVAAVCSTVLLLLGVTYVVYRRIRQPDWRAGRDVESGYGVGRKWAISAPIPIVTSEMGQSMPETKGAYTAVPGGHTQLEVSHPTTKAKAKAGGRWRLWGIPTICKTTHEDCESLIVSDSGSGRMSCDISDEDWSHAGDASYSGAAGVLWRSVFELPGGSEAKRSSRYSLIQTAFESRRKSNPPVKIVITKPEPTATATPSRPSPSLQRSSIDTVRSSNSSPPRQPLAFDPLRSNPVQLRRDPSLRQTKSTHDLPSPLRSTPPDATPVVRRPRSAEPGPDRLKLGYDLVTLQLYLDQTVADLDAGWEEPSAKSKPPSVAVAVPTAAATHAGRNAPSRPLRRAKNHVPAVGTTNQELDLRTVYRIEAGEGESL
ncbi:hypothetical protein B0T17DRAFT_522889 [Bombardia bombarda]|uniref:Uncharacterized protein n=1 Tax=Bombardia bombarda TaxID=252184 RepID=A0AA39X7F9_9PEZI|nr:hypothetical protein B0T17DRAFT_522889 [Bombardia bombarda]